MLRRESRPELRRQVRQLRDLINTRLTEVADSRGTSTATVAHLPVTIAARALIADLAGALPLEAVRDGEVITPTPSLLVRPDPAMTQRRWVHRAAMSLTGDGNLYVHPLRIGSNDWPLSAEVIPPGRVSYRTDPYRPWRVGAWMWAGAEVAPDELVHVPLWELDLDVPTSPSPLASCQAAFDDLAAMWAFASQYWTEGGKPPYALKYPSRLDKTKAMAQLDTWVEARRRHRPGLLTGAWEIQDLSLPTAQDALLLDGLAYIGQAVAQVYGLPPTLLNVRAETGSLTYSNARDEVTRWLYLSLAPTWLARIAEAFTLMTPAGQQVRFNTDSLGMGPAPMDEGAPSGEPASSDGVPASSPLPPAPPSPGSMGSLVAALPNGSRP